MTFQRYETKYMLSPIMARKLRKSLPGHLQMDEYGLGYHLQPLLRYGSPAHPPFAGKTRLQKKKKTGDSAVMVRKETSPIYVELKKNMKESSTNAASA